MHQPGVFRGRFVDRVRAEFRFPETGRFISPLLKDGYVPAVPPTPPSQQMKKLSVVLPPKPEVVLPKPLKHADRSPVSASPTHSSPVPPSPVPPSPMHSSPVPLSHSSPVHPAPHDAHDALGVYLL